MKARPILMSAPMVRSLIAGSKTQTRRVIKPQPDAATNRWSSDEVNAAWQEGFVKVPCPYGRKGDLLWVKETWADVNTENGPALAYRAGGLHFCVDDAYPVEYERYPGMQFTMWCGDLERGEPGHRWRSPLHMPKWASRLTLELTDVRVERLRSISEEDAIAEGLKAETASSGHVTYHIPGLFCGQTPQRAYRLLWESINGPGSWDANDWVWCLSFRVHQVNVGAFLKGEGV